MEIPPWKNQLTKQRLHSRHRQPVPRVNSLPPASLVTNPVPFSWSQELLKLLLLRRV